MNISNISPNGTRKNCSGSHKKALTFAYRVGGGVYINLTNRCTNDCTFCLRNNADSAYGSGVLWLEREPSAAEAFEAARTIADGCKEFVFCGYGEPMCRAGALIETAKLLKAEYPDIPVRINTNGQSDLINGRDVVPELTGLIDTVSISLNTPDPEAYVRVCRPAYGEKAYHAMLDFASRCAAKLPHVVFSAVRETLTEEETLKCEEIARKTGARLRLRDYISENNQNG